MGGYDGSGKKMLDSCEKYSIAKNEWTLIEAMQKPKCAFAAAATSNGIFIFGGFDGKERLAQIEKYSLHDKKWHVLDVKFAKSFSNAAAVAINDQEILILGGGYNFIIKIKSWFHI